MSNSNSDKEDKGLVLNSGETPRRSTPRESEPINSGDSANGGDEQVESEGHHSGDEDADDINNREYCGKN